MVGSYLCRTLLEQTMNEGTNNEYSSLESGLEEPLSDTTVRPLSSMMRQSSVNQRQYHIQSSYILLVNAMSGIFPSYESRYKRNFLPLILWSLYPVSIIIYYVWLFQDVMVNDGPLFGNVDRTFRTLRVWSFIAVGILVPATLSYTQQAYSNAMGRVAENILLKEAKRHLSICASISIVYFLAIYLAYTFTKKTTELPSDIKWCYDHPWSLLFSVPNFISMFRLLIMRCVTLERLHCEANKSLMKLAQCNDARLFQQESIECNKDIVEGSKEYLQLPLAAAFTTCSIWFFALVTLMWRNNRVDFYVFQSLFILLAGSSLTCPLYPLAKIDLRSFYVREALCRNVQMPMAELSGVLATFESIAPRAMLFGFYVTRPRLVSLIILLASSVVPRYISLFVGGSGA